MSIVTNTEGAGYMKTLSRMVGIMLVTLLFVNWVSGVFSADQETPAKPKMSSEMIHVYGKCSINGYNLPIGSVVEAFDPNGILCGKFEVTSPGYYGLMNIFRDDPETAGDEGADPGEVISITIDGMSAGIVAETPLVWTKDGDSIETDLLIGTPDTEKPSLAKVEILNPMQVKLTFTEAIADDTGQNVHYYSIKDQGGNTLDINRAIVQTDAREIILLTSELKEQTFYSVKVTNEVTDLWGNPLKETTGLNCIF